MLAPGAMSPNEQLRVFDAIEHPATDGLIVHVMPVPVGSGSLRVTPFAVPPGEALFETTTVNPIVSPAETEAASAVFVIVSPGDFMVKHSVVVLVWLPTEYWAVASGLYSARKQYVPSAVGVNADEVAVPALTATAPPTWVPPVAQFGGDPTAP